MFKLELTQEHLYYIDMALGEILHKYASPIIETINRQITEQKAAEEAAKAVEVAKEHVGGTDAPA